MYTPKGEINEELLKLCTQTDFLQKEIGDVGLTTPEECWEVAKRHIPDITFEDFTKSMAVMYQYVLGVQDGLLTEEDLDLVAGGKMDKGGAAMIGVGVVAAVVPSAIAAAGTLI